MFMEIMILNIPPKFKEEDGKWSENGDWIADVERVLGKKVTRAQGMNKTQSFRVCITVPDADGKDIQKLQRNLYHALGKFS